MPDADTDGHDILVVDDDAGLVRLFTLTLERAGFSVSQAGSAEAALDWLATHEVGLVLSDVGLPGMSGIEFARQMRRRTDTETLPIILVTGSGEDATVVAGLESGADDYLEKPVRLDELVARVRAQLRTRAAWTRAVQDELKVRSGAVAALRTLRVSSSATETAETIVAELQRRTDFDFVAVAQVVGDTQLDELASFERIPGSGPPIPPGLAAYMIDRVRTGPWVDQIQTPELQHGSALQNAGHIELVASAPIFDDEDLVGILSMGSGSDPGRSVSSRQARLLAAAIDYANVLSMLAGPAIADSRETGALRERMQGVLASKAFHPVFQPIVEVETGTVVGHEALTRFEDGTPPDVRFAEAVRVGLGPKLELAAVELAIAEAIHLPAGMYLTVNLSPATVIDHVFELRAIVELAPRRLVIELTEHVPIDDYHGLRAALKAIDDDLLVAVDDAGAGYASLRHILELRPAFAKMDISLVRGIDGDELRQALAAGLNYFGLRTGCRLIAEGVETKEEAATLARIGIEFAQGYLYGTPSRIARE